MPPPDIGTTGRRRLASVIGVAILAIAAVAGGGVAVERTARTTLIAAGQPAPPFSLPATTGSTISLADASGYPLVLGFVPSVLCGTCRGQLRALDDAKQALRAEGVVILAVSVDALPEQRAAAADLHLSYPLLSEAPTRGKHPVGSAYGLYHLPQPNPGPVDTNAVVVIDAGGIVRAVETRPDGVVTVEEIAALVRQTSGGAR